MHGGKLFKQLQHGHRKYRKGSRAKRVIILNKAGIERRPVIVDKKKRFGIWKADAVLGKNITGTIVSLVDRKKQAVPNTKSASEKRS